MNPPKDPTRPFSLRDQFPTVRPVMGKGVTGLEKWRQSMIFRRYGRLEHTSIELAELDAELQSYKAFCCLITRKKG